jgi:AraC-like DNA-binding protein
MSSGMVSVLTARILIEQSGRLGIPKENLLSALNLRHSDIQDPKGRIAVEQVYALWEEILDFTHDPMFALHAAERVPFGAYNILDYMLAMSSVPEQGLALSSRYFGLMNEAFRLNFYNRTDSVFLELESATKSLPIPRPYIEYILLNYLLRIRFATQVDIKPLEVHVTYAAPKSTMEYDRVFKSRVRFKQPGTRIIFSREAMKIPHPFADPDLCEALQDHAAQKLRALTDGSQPISRIREALLHNLKAGRTSLLDLSRQIAESPRSLQRKLHASGTSFGELLDEVRRERAEDLLENHNLRMGEVSIKLGFADYSSFCHAFHRWTGTSPAKYRKRADNSC